MDMDRFRAELRAFVDELYTGENKVLVYGEGPLRPELMLIGEAPGEQEALAGRPFVGKAGRNLDEMLEKCGLTRAQIYIGNAVKFRPVKQSRAGRTVNRPPTQEEIGLFRPWLLREIDIVRPALIATLGNVPLRALTGRALTVGQEHGRLLVEGGMRIFPMYHPASMIYNPSLKAVFEEDLRTLAGIVAGQTR
ncbi:MAG: uracil-DNA glycosylase [Candidatus Fimadaptatus sp.]